MFDIGFSELMVIAVVALVVIGPERLPKVARTAGHLIGRLQRYVNDVKADINREMELEELKKFKAEFEKSAQSVESQVNAELHKTEEIFKTIEAEINPHPTVADSAENTSSSSTRLSVSQNETGPGLESGSMDMSSENQQKPQLAAANHGAPATHI